MARLRSFYSPDCRTVCYRSEGREGPLLSSRGQEICSNSNLRRSSRSLAFRFVGRFSMEIGVVPMSIRQAARTRNSTPSFDGIALRERPPFPTHHGDDSHQHLRHAALVCSYISMRTADSRTITARTRYAGWRANDHHVDSCWISSRFATDRILERRGSSCRLCGPMRRVLSQSSNIAVVNTRQQLSSSSRLSIVFSSHPPAPAPAAISQSGIGCW